MSSDACVVEWNSWNFNLITRMKMTTKGSTIHFQGSCQQCELSSCIVLFRRFVMHPFLLAVIYMHKLSQHSSRAFILLL